MFETTKRVYKRTSPEMVDEMVRLYKEGLSQMEIGRKMGLHNSTISRFLIARGYRYSGRRKDFGVPKAVTVVAKEEAKPLVIPVNVMQKVMRGEVVYIAHNGALIGLIKE